MALLSKGQTIAESLATAKASTRQEMEYYVQRHRPRMGRKGFSRENLETVYALQDGVSRVEKALAAGRGGTGFMDMLSFFASLGATTNPDWKPKFSIVSGRTCVRIMAPYTEGRLMTAHPSADGLLPPRELWFNMANSPSAAPDAAHVLELPAKLQGTLITIAWTIDREFLEKTANHGT